MVRRLAVWLRWLADRVDDPAASPTTAVGRPRLSAAAAAARRLERVAAAAAGSDDGPSRAWVAERRHEARYLAVFEELIERLSLAASEAADRTGGDGDAVEDVVAEEGGLDRLRRDRVALLWALEFPDLAWHLEGLKGLWRE